MTLDLLVAEAQIFLLVFARILVFVEIVPLLNSSAIPQIGKIGLTFFISFAILPSIINSGVYHIPDNGVMYAFLLIGEALIGAIMAFFINIIMSVFQLAGQFFSTQMGLASSQVYDPLAQVQIPLIGQFLNLTAMLVFLTIHGIQKLFLGGISRSFEVVTVSKVVENLDNVVPMLLSSVSGLFGQALVIALPVMGVLLLMQITMGLLAKAAPQMNLLMLSFPLNIMMAYIVLVAAMPLMIQTFETILDGAFSSMGDLVNAMAGGAH
ncbi:MAG: flagellar biosynthetic protein FliR [Spirochaetales bacterium]|nr:flagellar biosynthetic protein FliR [Spirochaetales bacterium]